MEIIRQEPGDVNNIYSEYLNAVIKETLDSVTPNKTIGTSNNSSFHRLKGI